MLHHGSQGKAAHSPVLFKLWFLLGFPVQFEADGFDTENRPRASMRGFRCFAAFRGGVSGSRGSGFGFGV